jgi:uncharacterized protein (DUF924 family)
MALGRSPAARPGFGKEEEATAYEKGGTLVTDPKEVLSWWFPEKDLWDADREAFGRRMGWWFAGGPEVDREIAERFGGVLERARKGELDQWARTPRGRLALIVVLDQFSRNAHRGSPEAYAQDEKAQNLALEGIEAGMDRGLTFGERVFFWMPLTHSEELALQDRSVRHAAEEAANAPAHLRAEMGFGVSQARGTRDVIARFGRHPHRNAVLGRASTPEELEYLRTETPPHMRRPPT